MAKKIGQKTDWETRLNNFYRMQYQWLLRVLNLLLISMAVIFGIMLYVDYTKPWPRYYSSATDGSIKRIYALSRPMVGTKALRDWATLVAVSAYTFNFGTYADRFKETSVFFTSDAWSKFIDSLEANNVIDDVITKKLIISAVAEGATVVLDQRMIADKWVWNVQVPLLVSYRGGIKPFEDHLVINMLITRVPSREIPKGIAVKRFYASSAAPGGSKAAPESALGG